MRAPLVLALAVAMVAPLAVAQETPEASLRVKQLTDGISIYWTYSYDSGINATTPEIWVPPDAVNASVFLSNPYRQSAVKSLADVGSLLDDDRKLHHWAIHLDRFGIAVNGTGSFVVAVAYLVPGRSTWQAVDESQVHVTLSPLTRYAPVLDGETLLMQGTQDGADVFAPPLDAMFRPEPGEPFKVAFDGQSGFQAESVGAGTAAGFALGLVAGLLVLALLKRRRR